MNIKRLNKHIKLCQRNLSSKRVKCCAYCPFEEEIIKYHPELALLFREKRRSMKK